MTIIKLMLDYDEGPIWPNHLNPITFEKSTGIEIIDNDEEINNIATKMNDMYDDYFVFDSHNVACWFNREKFVEEKDIMLSLLNKLTMRLNELNDGSFVVVDKITEMYFE